MKLQNHIRPFPVLDYKLPPGETIINADKQNYRTYKQQQYSKPRQTAISEYSLQ